MITKPDGPRDPDGLAKAMERAAVDLGGGRVPLSAFIALALLEPERFVERESVRGRAVEPKSSWQARAVWEVLWAHGVNPHECDEAFRS